MVVSGPIDELIPICDDGTGPIETSHEVVCVDAPSKAKAKVAGLRLMKDWPGYQRQDGCSPFTGVTVEEITACPHGLRWCECDEYCDECDDVAAFLDGVLLVATGSRYGADA